MREAHNKGRLCAVAVHFDVDLQTGQLKRPHDAWVHRRRLGTGAQRLERESIVLCSDRKSHLRQLAAAGVICAQKQELCRTLAVAAFEQ
jgi:hypothetical protein